MNQWRPWPYNALLALSAANLCFLRVWVEFLGRGPESAFYLKRPAPPAAFGALILNVVLVGALFYLAILVLRKLLAIGRTGLAFALFFLIALVPLNSLRSVAALEIPILRSHLMRLIGVEAALAVVALGVLVLGTGLFLMRRRLLTVSAYAITALSPLIVILWGQAVWRMATYSHDEYRDRPLAARLNTHPGNGPRVVWMIFDELDYRLAFENRPADVPMPEFDRLRSEAVFATRAEAPFIDTIPSVPSLLSGRPYTRFKTGTPSELFLAESDPPVFEPWNAASTVFASARQMGLDTGVAGFYIPYCRLLNDALTDCYWEDIGQMLNTVDGDFGHAVPNQLESLFETSFFSPFGQSLLVKLRATVLGRIQANARRMVSDPMLEVVFVHWPTPHAPHPYDRFRKSLTRSNAPFTGYLDSLALSDVLLGEVRAEMEAAGLWDRTTVLVSSDHPYRNSRMLDGKSDNRVPFLLKLANQRRGVEYTAPLQTLCSRSLVESVLRGELNRPEQVVDWLISGTKSTIRTTPGQTATPASARRVVANQSATEPATAR